MSLTGGQRTPDAILFDLDNTLYDFIDAKREACIKAVTCIESGDGDDLFRYFLRSVHGFEDPENIADYLRDTGLYEKELVDQMSTIYEQVKMDSIRLYPGVIKTLTIISGHDIPLGIVTDADSDHARKRMQKLHLDTFFSVLITPDISGKRKPDHTPFLMAVESLQALPENTWIIGDSLRRETIPGKELGMTTVYARYGDWLKKEKIEDAHPDFTLDYFPDLLTYLKISEWEKNTECRNG